VAAWWGGGGAGQDQNGAAFVDSSLLPLLLESDLSDAHKSYVQSSRGGHSVQAAAFMENEVRSCKQRGSWMPQ
jgi:hypothetical protein